MSNSNRTPEKVTAFCAALAETANIGKACAAVGMGRTTAYDWRDDDPEFAARWDRAMQIGVTALEDEVKRRAFDGVDEPLVHQGQVTFVMEEKRTKSGRVMIDKATGLPRLVIKRDEQGNRIVASIKKYSDQLAIVLLKAHAPDKYRDNSKVEMAGAMEFSSMSNSELLDQIHVLEQQLATTAAALLPTAKPEPEDGDEFDIPD